jgi:chemosensory pili system protein ChpA (sensor histidine kinase/response regulator)
MSRILIVDDDESDRLLEQTILTKAGHDVVCSEGGEEALRRQLEGGVDLVITDLQMPDVHGFELIAIFRDLLPSPPIIAISGTGEFQLDMARQLGATFTLSKPIDPDRLLAAVDRALQGRPR